MYEIDRRARAKITVPMTIVTLCMLCACGGERGGLDAEIAEADDANSSVSSIRSTDVLAFRRGGPFEISTQDATTEHVEENPQCVSLRISICEADIEATAYEVAAAGAGPQCEPGTASLSVEERGADCSGSKSWVSRSGTVTVESVDEDEVHLRFDVLVGVTEIQPQTATGGFRIRGTMWTDEIQTED